MSSLDSKKVKKLAFSFIFSNSLKPYYLAVKRSRVSEPTVGIAEGPLEVLSPSSFLCQTFRTGKGC